MLGTQTSISLSPGPDCASQKRSSTYRTSHPLLARWHFIVPTQQVRRPCSIPRFCPSRSAFYLPPPEPLPSTRRAPGLTPDKDPSADMAGAKVLAPVALAESFRAGSVAPRAPSSLAAGRTPFLQAAAFPESLSPALPQQARPCRKACVVQAVIDVPAGRGSSSSSSGEDPLPLLRRDWQSSIAFPSAGEASPDYVSAERRIHEAVVRTAASTAQSFLLQKELSTGPEEALAPALAGAYDRCGEVCAEYAKTFFLGTKLMTPERQRAIWAIYVWCRRTDELVDGPNASHITPRALDRWEERLEDLFAGQPYDMLDAALSHTIQQYPMSIQPFRDMIDGMRMDLRKSRYSCFDELYVYCYNVAGTVGLMSVPVMGIDPASRAPWESVYGAAMALGIANQLTNILRDVGEDAQRGRVYLPQDELAAFGLSDEDIFAGQVTPKWRNFMRFQIQRAREYFDRAEAGVPELDAKSRWPVWASLSLYRQILDAIEANDYNNFTQRAYVSKWKKMLSLPGSYLVALKGPASPDQLKQAGLV